MVEVLREKRLKKYKAFIFDLNGTMIDDMQYHINAWYRILNDLGAKIGMEKVKAECYGKNNELLERIFPGRFNEEEKNKLSFDKEYAYQEKFKPNLKLIDGLEHFLAEAAINKMKMAIGSAAIAYNINFVLDGLDIRKYFETVVGAEDVRQSKPNPETFLKCAQLLNIHPEDCLVFEDAPKGVEAAKLAKMDCIVITTMHQAKEFKSENIVLCLNDFLSEDLKCLFEIDL